MEDIPRIIIGTKSVGEYFFAINKLMSDRDADEVNVLTMHIPDRIRKVKEIISIMNNIGYIDEIELEKDFECIDDRTKNKIKVQKYIIKLIPLLQKQ